MNTNKMYMFVAEWCPHCRAAKESIFRLIETYGENNNIELFEDTSEAYREKGMKLKVFGVPTIMIVDEKENVVKIWDGPRDYGSLVRFYIESTESKISDADQAWLESGN